MSNKSIFGLSEDLASVVAYAGFFLTGALVLVLERENKKVMFNALQSVIVFGGLTVAGGLIKFVPLLGGLISSLLGIVCLLTWAYLMFMSYKGIVFRVPYIGDAVHNQIYK
jgi:uncharacterized membrane protein